MKLVLDSMLRHKNDADIQRAGMYALCHFEGEDNDDDTGLVTTVIIPAILNAIFKAIESNEDLTAKAFETYRLLISSLHGSDWIKKMIKDGLIDQVVAAVCSAFRVIFIPLRQEDQNKINLKSGDSVILGWNFLGEFAFDLTIVEFGDDETFLFDRLLDEDEEPSSKKDLRSAVQASLMKHSVDMSVIVEAMQLHPENYWLLDTACAYLNRLLSTICASLSSFDLLTHVHT